MDTREYIKKAPTRRTSRIVIICEGEKRELNYFSQYEKTQGRVLVEVVAPKSKGKSHDPLGLFNYAKSKERSGYIDKTDSVWFVFDTDQWTDIPDTRQKMENQKWRTAQSNPCFEVWLMFHHKESIPSDAPLTAKEWKIYLDNEQRIKSVDYQDDGIRELAKINAENCYSCESNGTPSLNCTEMHLLIEELTNNRGANEF